MTIALTDVATPEQSWDRIIAILQSNRMPLRLPTIKDFDYNCWGFTAFYLSWTNQVSWMPADQMEKHLTANTTPIPANTVQAGDVAIFRQREWLAHTAIMLPDSNFVCHKPGQGLLSIDTLAHAKNMYGDKVSFARATNTIK
jgi:hypothetical protein